MISSYRIAELCGISRGTVVRALTGKGRIAPATKSRIVAAARRHGYVAHPLVSETIRGSSRVVGAVIPENAGSALMAHLRGVTAALRARDLSLFIAQADDQNGYDAAIREFAARRARALLVVPPIWKLEIDPALREHMRIATFPHTLAYKNVQSVQYDARGISRLQVGHCAAKGHGRIAYLTMSSHLSHSRDRLKGYLAAMRAIGRPSRVVAFDVGESFDRLPKMPPEVVRMVLNDGATSAVCCRSGWIAAAFILACARMGVRVPEDVSVIGAEGSPEMMDLWPHLTEVRVDRMAVGRAIAQWADTGVMPRLNSPYSLREGSTVIAAKLRN